jgi:hypothetical protein
LSINDPVADINPHQDWPLSDAFGALKFIVFSHSAPAVSAGLFSLAPARRICKTAATRLRGVIMALTLYHNDMSVCAQKVRLCLAEKQLAYEDRHLNLRAGDQKRPEYLALNPNGYVPTLVHDDFVLGESTVICEYIDDAFTAPPLKPADPKERARMRGFTKFIDAAIFPATATVSMSIAFHHQFTPDSSVSRRYSAARQDDRRYGTSARRPPRSVARGRNLYAG